jgi:hypothetical protein
MDEKMTDYQVGLDYVGGPAGLAEISCQNGGDQNSRRTRFLLCGGWKGRPERGGGKKLADGELWDVRRCEY